MAVFPEAKWFSGQNFRVKIEIQNSISEFASRYGMPVGEIGNGIGNGCRLALPAPAPARRPAGLARPATATGHRLRPGLPATDRPHGHGLRPWPPDTDGHGRTRTRQAGQRGDVAKRRPGCGRL